MIKVRSILAGFAAGAVAACLGVPAVLAVDNPTVTKVTPHVGSGNGGDSLTVYGSGFWCGSPTDPWNNPSTATSTTTERVAPRVFVGPNAAAITNLDSDNQLEAVTPAGTGTVDVVVYCGAYQGGQTGSSPTAADRWTYIDDVGNGGIPNSTGGSSSGSGLDNSGTGQPAGLAQTGAHLPLPSSPALPAVAVVALVMLSGGGLALTRRRARR